MEYVHGDIKGKDDNAKGRHTIMFAALMGMTPSFLCHDARFSEAGELECAGHLIDILDATEKQNGINIANFAPRGGSGKKYANATPLDWFKYTETTCPSLKMRVMGYNEETFFR